MLDAYIVDSVRTPRGLASKGSLANVKPVDLLAPLYQALIERNDIDSNNIDQIILGCSSPTGAQGANIAKISALYAGLPSSLSASVISRFCCSGLDAINQAAALLHCNNSGLMIAGGVESLSQVPLFADKGAWFADPAVAAKSKFIHMGVAADLLATRRGYSREQLDSYAVRSHQRAAQAQQKDRFKNSIVYIGDCQRDESVRENSLSNLSALAASFADIQDGYFDKLCLQQYSELEKIEHHHHIGNAPQQTDGASLLLMANATAMDGGSAGNAGAIASATLKPRARLTQFSVASGEPVQMLDGHVLATQKLLEKAELKASDIDLWEVNESFSATVLNYQEQFAIDDDKLNVNGGAIALGHPLGATGGVLVATVLDELERQGKQRAIVAIPAGAGLGTTTLIERSSQ